MSIRNLLTLSTAVKAVWVTAFVLAAHLGFTRYVVRGSNGGDAFRPAVSPSPLVAHTISLQEILTSGAGKEQKGMLVTLALRSDGGYVERMDFATRNNAESARHIFELGKPFVATDEVRGTWTRQFGSHSQREPKHDCMATADGQPINSGERSVGTEVIEGHKTVKVQGAVLNWFALDLSCSSLQLRMNFDRGNSERRLLGVSLGEPRAELFSVNGLREVSVRAK